MSQTENKSSGGRSSSRRRNARTQLEAEVAELEAQEQGDQGDQQQRDEPSTPTATITTTAASAPTPASSVAPEQPRDREDEQVIPPASNTQVKPGKQARHIEEDEEEEDEEDDELFEDLYKRTTYYIRRTNIPRLKKLVRKFKRGPERRPKYDLMEEALEYLFEKYGIE